MPWDQDQDFIFLDLKTLQGQQLQSPSGQPMLAVHLSAQWRCFLHPQRDPLLFQFVCHLWLLLPTWGKSLAPFSSCGRGGGAGCCHGHHGYPTQPLGFPDQTWCPDVAVGGSLHSLVCWPCSREAVCPAAARVFLSSPLPFESRSWWPFQLSSSPVVTSTRLSPGPDLAFLLAVFQKVPVSPCLPPVLVPLGGSPALKCMARSLQCGVTHKLDENALSLLLRSGIKMLNETSLG